LRINIFNVISKIDHHTTLKDEVLPYPLILFLKTYKNEMSSKKVLKKNILSKFFVFLSFPILKRYYLIYEDGSEIVLLEKGKEYKVGNIFR